MQRGKKSKQNKTSINFPVFPPEFQKFRGIPVGTLAHNNFLAGRYEWTHTPRVDWKSCDELTSRQRVLASLWQCPRR